MTVSTHSDYILSLFAPLNVVLHILVFYLLNWGSLIAWLFLRSLQILSLYTYILVECSLFGCLWMHVLTIEASFGGDTNTVKYDVLVAWFGF